jgi:hypothetical protein
MKYNEANNINVFHITKITATRLFIVYVTTLYQLHRLYSVECHDNYECELEESECGVF